MCWVIFIEARRPGEGCFATYWHAGELGESLAAALRHSEAELQLAEPRAQSVGAGPDEPPEDFLDVGDGLFAAKKVPCWSLSPEDSDFVLPTGVVFAEEGTPFDLEEVVEARSAGAEEDYCWAELVVDDRRLRDVFLAQFSHLPIADGLEIRTLGHWDDAGITQVWIGDREKFHGIYIWRFLEEHWPDLVDNGFIELAVYSRQTDSILRLTEHKTILFTAGSPAERDRFVQKSEELGYRETDPFRSIVNECVHYHYRPPESMSRSDLLAALESWGFREVDSWEETAQLLGDEGDPQT